MEEPTYIWCPTTFAQLRLGLEVRLRPSMGADVSLKGEPAKRLRALTEAFEHFMQLPVITPDGREHHDIVSADDAYLWTLELIGEFVSTGRRSLPFLRRYLFDDGVGLAEAFEKIDGPWHSW